MWAQCRSRIAAVFRRPGMAEEQRHRCRTPQPGARRCRIRRKFYGQTGTQLERYEVPADGSRRWDCGVAERVSHPPTTRRLYRRCLRSRPRVQTTQGRSRWHWPGRLGSKEMKLSGEVTRNLLFTGKGGVGKTSVACATAISRSEEHTSELQSL